MKSLNGRATSRKILVGGFLGRCRQQLLIATFALFSLIAHAAPADLVINHSDTGFDPVPAGGIVTYRIVVAINDIAVTANNLVLTDTLPLTTTFVSAVVINGAGSCGAPSAGVLTCTNPTLTQPSFWTIDVTVRTTLQGTITNSATVTHDAADANPVNNVNIPQATTVNAGADVSVTKAAMPTPVRAGGTFSYNLTVANAGPDPATNLRVVDNLPALPGFSVTAALPAGCSQAGQQITCSIAGPIAASGTVIIGPITGIVGVGSGATLTNAVDVALDPAAPPTAPRDPISTNNTFTLNNLVLAGTDVSITKTQVPTTNVIVGETVTFTLNPRYSGDFPAGLLITDDLPVNYSYVGATPFTQGSWTCSVSGQAVSCTQAGIGAAGLDQPLGNIVFPVQVVAVGAGVVNTATISTTTTPEANPLNNTSSTVGVTIVPPASDLQASKSRNIVQSIVVNEPVQFTISVRNNGPSGHVGTVTLTDTIPAGFQVDSFDTLNGFTCPAVPIIGPASFDCTRIYPGGGPFANQASVSVVYTGRATTNGTKINTLCVKTTGTPADPDGNATCTGNNQVTLSSDAQVGGVSADISVTKSASGTVNMGDILTYSFEVRNVTAGVPSVDATLTDTFDKLLNTTVGASLALAANESFAFQWALNGGPNIAPICTTTPSAGNTIALSCVFASFVQCTPGANCPTLSVAVRALDDNPSNVNVTRTNSVLFESNITADTNRPNNTASVGSALAPSVDMTVTKTDNPDPVQAGTQLTYVITAQNAGPGRAHGVTITDTLPLGVVFISAAPSVGSCGTTPGAGVTTTGGNRTLICSLNDIGRNTQQTVTVRVRPGFGVSDPLVNTSISNSVDVATTTPESTTANNTATQATTVTPPRVDLLANKIDSVDPVTKGDPYVYTLRVTNNATAGAGSFAENIVVVDTFPISSPGFTGSASFQGIGTLPTTSALGAAVSVACPRVSTALPAVNATSGTIECSISLLAVGDRVDIPVNFRGEGKGTFQNQLSTSILTPFGPAELNPTNNTVIEPTTIRTKADVEVVSKTPSVATVSLGGSFSWAVAIRNNGPDEAEVVRFQDSLPNGMVLTGTPSVGSIVGGGWLPAAPTCNGIAGGTSFSCDFTFIPNGGTALITVPVRMASLPSPPAAPATTQVFTNRGSIAPQAISTASFDTNGGTNPNFGNNFNDGDVTVRFARISGRVYQDADVSGVLNAGDTGITGVTVRLCGVDAFANNIGGGAPAGPAAGCPGGALTSVTNGAGAYSFVVPPGTYTLEETQPGGVTDYRENLGTGASTAGTVQSPLIYGSGPEFNRINGIVLAANDNAIDYNFGEIEGSSVTGFVFEDNNNNGQRDAGEAAIVGVMMRLTGTDYLGNPVTLTVATDATGKYTFTVAPSNATGYTVEQVVQPAGFFDGKEILGQVAAGAPPPANVIPNSSNAAGATGYAAGGVATGATNAATDRIAGIVVGGGQEHHDNDFGEIRPAQVTGAVYFDVNNNVNREPGETLGVPGIVVTITGTDLNGNPVVASTTATTNASGDYTFTNLLPGTYSVSQGTAAGYGHSGASVQGPNALGVNFLNRPGLSTITVVAGTAAGGVIAPAINTIAIGPGGTSPGNNFGEIPSSLAGRVCFDNSIGVNGNNGRCDAGEPGILGVSVTLTGTAVDGTVVNTTVVTDASGNYVFSSLKIPNAGGYTITQTQPAGILDGKQTTGALTPVPAAPVDAGANVGTATTPTGTDTISGIRFTRSTNGIGYDFGELRPASISGFVYADSNTNNVRDVGVDPGIPGVTVTLTGTDIDGSAVNIVVVTDATGLYTFPNLRPGSYVVVETQPSFATQGANNIGTGPATPGTNPLLDRFAITLRENENAVNFNFGELAASVAGFVYEDLNGNGVKEVGEPGIAGVAIQLTGADTNSVAVTRNTVTAADGSYFFTALLASNGAGYTVTETQPGAYVDGLDTRGTVGGVARGSAAVNDVISGVVISAADTAINYNFGEVRRGSIAGFVYTDSDNSGTRTAGDAPLAGVAIALSGTDFRGAPVSLNTTTDATGAYSFANLLPGSYTVTETQPAGYADATTNPGTAGGVAGPTTISSIALQSNQNSVNNNFGETFTLITLSGTVFEDNNNDGIQAPPGERGIAGVTITITGRDLFGNAVNAIATTDVNGQYVFTGLRPSDGAGYTVTETQPPAYLDGRTIAGGAGGTVSNNVISAIVLTAGSASVVGGYNFAELRPAAISGSVYNDLNNNGTRDAGEPGIAGTIIRLTGTDDRGIAVVLNTTTDASGAYVFPNLRPATYTVTETQPATFQDGRETVGSLGGSAAINDVISGIALKPGDAGANYNFGELQFGLSGTVYEDNNNDGIQGPDEPGIAGVVITVTGNDAQGNPVNLTATTDAQGRYSFPSVPPSGPAGYTITEVQPAAYLEGRATPGNTGGSANPNGNVITGVILGNGGPTNGSNYNFGELKPASLAGGVYEDSNNNGSRDTGEPAIVGTTVRLTGIDDRGSAVNLTTTTGASGNYTFPNLRPGTYTVTETQPVSFADGRESVGSLGGISTVNDVISNIVVRSGDTGTGYNFGELAGGIGGQVYVDLNNNGVRDAGETGIPGVTVTLTGTDVNGNAVTRTVATDGNGQYLFGGLLASNAAGYTVTETQPAAYADGLDRAGSLGGVVGNDRTSNIVFPGGTVALGYDFGERGSSIGGTVYVDGNDNGLQDSGEPGIVGVTITLSGVDVNGNAITRTVTTGANGSYRFDGLPLPGPNGYTITEAQPTGFLDGRETVGSLGGTVPANDAFNVRFTTPGSTGTGYNFGERLTNPAAICGQVYLDVNGDRANNDGRTGQPNWIVELTVVGADGRAVVLANTRTDATGNYCFNNLAPGTYTVVFRNPANGITAGRRADVVVTTGTLILNQDFPIDPSGIVFDNCTGQPIAGVRFFMSGPPGFDPDIHLTDPAMQGQAVGADGFYQFFLTPNAPAGIYTLSFVTPPGYSPNGQTTPQTTVLNATTCPIDPNPVAPCFVNPTTNVAAFRTCGGVPPGGGVGPGTGGTQIVGEIIRPGPIYFDRFLIVPTGPGGGGPAPQDVLNNHLGLTALPTGTFIDLRKSTLRLNVVRGDLVPYTLTMRSLTTRTLTNVFVVDTIPPGFRFVPGSARIAGGSIGNAPVDILPQVNGRNLAFPIARVAPTDVYSLSMLLAVGPGVGEGEYINYAVVRAGSPQGGGLSNLAQAAVRVVADPLFDCTDIIGKVFDDRNANGYQDEGEPGLKGARVVSARGITATSDAEGRYHVACAAVPQMDIGSNFVLKLDERSLPSGYRVTTENPLTERLTRGKAVRMNFGATIHRVVRIDLSSSAFESGGNALKTDLRSRVTEVMPLLAERPSILRIGYAPAHAESTSLTNARVDGLKALVKTLWADRPDPPDKPGEKRRSRLYGLEIEVEVVRDTTLVPGKVAVDGGAK